MTYEEKLEKIKEDQTNGTFPVHDNCGGEFEPSIKSTPVYSIGSRNVDFVSNYIYLRCKECGSMFVLGDKYFEDNE